MDWKKKARIGVVALAVMVLAAAALSSGSALAAKGGNAAGGGGRGGHKTPTPPPSSATLSYAPNPVPVGSAFTVNGAGFAPNTWVVVGFYGSQQAFYVMADAAGSFSWTYTGPNNYCGSFLFDAVQNSSTTYVYINVTGCP